jgi:hypothetical protein
MSFSSSFSFLTQNWKTGGQGKTGPAWGGWYQWQGGWGIQMEKKGEYGANTVYKCM